MLKHTTLLSILCIALFAVSCEQKAGDTLLQAGALLEQEPDSALACLKTIENPERLQKAQRMEYFLLWVQAKDKADKDITADTLLQEVQQYYLRKKQWDKATLAAFYAGRVFHVRKEYSRAMQTYLDAESYAGHIDNNIRKGLIQHNLGGLYYKELIRDEAEKRLKAAFHYFKLGHKPKYLVNTASLLGNCFLAKQQPDSALYYQQQALDIAEHHGDSTAMSLAFQSLSSTYQQMKNSTLAKVYALKAIPLNPMKSYEIKAHIHLSSLYYDEHQLDTALNYARKAQQLLDEDKDAKKDWYMTVGVYDILSKINKEKGRYPEALHYHGLYTKALLNLYAETREKSIIGVQEQYQYERIKNEKNRLFIRYLCISILALAGSLVASVIALFYYRRSNRHKEELLQAKEQNKELKTSKLGIYKKTTLKELSTNKDGVKWDVHHPMLNEVTDGFPDLLKQQYPHLSEQEYKITCFIYAGYSNKEIAGLLHKKLNTIQTRKVTIRKKLGIPKQGDIYAFLISKICPK